MIGWNIWRIFLKQFRNRSTRIWWKGLGICMLSPCLLYSQQTETRLPIRFHEGFGPFSPAYYSVRWDDTSFISRSGFDQLSGLNPGYKSIRQAIIWFEFAQYVYQNWKFGLYPDERYHALKQTLGLKNDPEKLVDRRIRCYVNLITAVNVKGDTILVLDKNNNHDLSDDVELIVSSGDAGPEQLLREIQHVPYQRLFYGKVITDTAKISLTKSATGFGYSMAEYASTEVVVGSKKYPFLIFPEGFLSRSYARVGLLDQRNRYPDPYDSLVKNDEYLSLDGQILKFAGVDIQQNQAVFMKMTNKELYSPQVGFYAPLFESRELGSGRMYSLVTHKGRYTLIDFWGSWCLPCLKELPALKSVYDQADTARIGFLSVAVDDTAEDVMKIIRTQSISWPQIISDKLAALYNVNSFPSNFLLDPSGKIIAKDIKMDELKKFLAGLNTTTDE